MLGFIRLLRQDLFHAAWLCRPLHLLSSPLDFVVKRILWLKMVEWYFSTEDRLQNEDICSKFTRIWLHWFYTYLRVMLCYPMFDMFDFSCPLGSGTFCEASTDEVEEVRRISKNRKMKNTFLHSSLRARERNDGGMDRRAERRTLILIEMRKLNLIIDS